MQSRLDGQPIEISTTSLPEVEDLSSKVPDISIALAPVEVESDPFDGCRCTNGPACSLYRAARAEGMPPNGDPDHWIFYNEGR